MPRSKVDGRRKRSAAKTRNQKQEKVSYKHYNSDDLLHALRFIQRGKSVRQAAAKFDIPLSTLADSWAKFKASDLNDVSDKVNERSSHASVLTKEEEDAIERYALWQQDRGMPLIQIQVKALIRELHAKAVEKGEKRRTINGVKGPSFKYMREFYKRHPKLSMRSAESVDRGRINMASQDTITEYFDLLRDTMVKNGIGEACANGVSNIKEERVYLADETGWGVMSKKRKVVGRKGSSHVYTRKTNDESHKTLMLGVCGNGDVLSPLIILEKSFPLLGEEEAELLPSDVMLSKTENGSMEKELFADWLRKVVVPHKKKVNPDGSSLLILDNHGSRFSIEAIDLCIDNNIEILCYPGHLTHVLQGPDVVLNKPISTIVDDMIHSNIFISGNSDLS